MTVPLSLVARTARMLGMRDALDVGGAKMLFYTGLIAATPDTATTETLLARVVLGTPSGALGEDAGLATLTLVVPQTILAINSGLIGWLRLVNGVGQGFLDLPVGLVNSGAPAILNVLQVFTGGEFQLISCILAE